MFNKNKQEHFIYEGYQPTKPTFRGYVLRRLKSVNFYYVAVPVVSIVFALSAVILVVGGLVHPQQANRTKDLAWAVNRDNNQLKGWTTGVYNPPNIEPYFDGTDNNVMTIGFRPNSIYYQGTTICKNYTIPEGHAMADYSFIVDANEANTTRWFVMVNGVEYSTKENQGTHTDDYAPQLGTVTRYRAAQDLAGGLPAGTTVQVCIQSTAATGSQNGRGVYKFKDARYIRIVGYHIGGSQQVVVPDRYAYQKIGISPTAITVAPDGIAKVSITLRNSGDTPWYGEGNPNPVRLATNLPNTRSSVFVSGDGWLSAQRIKMRESIVAVDQDAHFDFTLHAPADKPAGHYFESFTLVAEGITWFENYESTANIPLDIQVKTGQPITVSAPQTDSGTISANNWNAWGFVPPSTPSHTILHGSDGQLTITYPRLSSGSYAGGTTACWAYSLPSGKTATSFKVTLKSNDQGANQILLRATGNPDKIVPRSTDGSVSWTLPTPVGAGGLLSICNKVVSTTNFTSDKTLTVSAYQISGSGGKVVDQTAPEISLKTPAAGSTAVLSGKTQLEAKAFDQSGIDYVQFKIDNAQSIGGQVVQGDASGSYALSWDSTTISNGTHEFYALARDKAGNYNESKHVSATVKNTTTRPTLADGTPGQPTPQTSPQLAPNTPCTTAIAMPFNVIERVQTQDTVTRSPFGKTTGAELRTTEAEADGCTAVGLSDKGRYVKVSFNADKIALGNYVVIVRGRSDVVKSNDAPDGLARATVKVEYDPKPLNGEAVQTYQNVIFNNSFKAQAIGQVAELKEHTKVSVTVTFANAYRDTSGTRKLWYDYAEIRSAAATSNPTTTPKSGNQPATTPAPAATPTKAAQPSCGAPAASDKESAPGLIEGEQAKRSGIGCSGYDPKATNPSADRSSNAGVLFTNNDSLSHTFTVPNGGDGIYNLDVLARSDILTSGDQALKPATYLVAIKPSSSDSVQAVSYEAGDRANPTNYALGTFPVNDPGKNTRLTLKAGQTVRVTVQLTNDARISCSSTSAPGCKSSDRNVWIDSIRLRKSSLDPIVSPKINTPSTSPATVPVTSTIEAAAPDSAQDVTCASKVSATSNSCASLASDGVVRFLYQGASMSYAFRSQYAGNGSAGFMLKSQPFRGNAKATIWLDDQKTEVTVASDKFRFYGFKTVGYGINSTHQLKVTFTNDACGYNAWFLHWGCSAKTDRNLLVSQIVITVPAQDTSSPSRSL